MAKMIFYFAKSVSKLCRLDALIVAHFEAVELLKTNKQHKENHLALYPTDAAKNNCQSFKGLAVILKSKNNRFNTPPDHDNTYPVNLAGNSETLTFSPLHLQDLKAILSS